MRTNAIRAAASRRNQARIYDTEFKLFLRSCHSAISRVLVFLLVTVNLFLPPNDYGVYLINRLFSGTCHASCSLEHVCTRHEIKVRLFCFCLLTVFSSSNGSDELALYPPIMMRIRRYVSPLLSLGFWSSRCVCARARYCSVSQLTVNVVPVQHCISNSPVTSFQ
jgi:hypothetical protein